MSGDLDRGSSCVGEVCGDGVGRGTEVVGGQAGGVRVNRRASGKQHGLRHGRETVGGWRTASEARGVVAQGWREPSQGGPERRGLGAGDLVVRRASKAHEKS